jgi:hypothetical protein
MTLQEQLSRENGWTPDINKGNVMVHTPGFNHE